MSALAGRSPLSTAEVATAADQWDPQTRIGVLLTEHVVRPDRSFAPQLL